MRTLHPQFSFTAGQVDSSLEQRGDLEAYYKALKKAENCIINITGGVNRRYGTRFLRNAPIGNVFRIIDYTARANGVDYTNIIVFGENTADVYNVETGNYLTSFVTGKTAALMSKCDYEIDGNKILFVHESVKPFQITFTGGSSTTPSNYAVSDIVFNNVPNYEFVVNDSTNVAWGTLTPSGTSGYITLTASSGTPFNGTMVGKKISISPIGVVRINQVVSSTVVKAFVEKKLQDTTAIEAGQWTIELGWEPIISDTRGYPRTLCFYAGRLYFGGTSALPNLLLASTIEDNYDFDLGDASDSDGFFEFTDSKDASHIYMLQARNTLEIYCNESVYVISTTGSVTPTTVKATRVSPTGIMQYSDAPLVSDGGSVYINNDRNGVFWMIYNFETQTYTCDIISELSSSLVSAAALPITYQTVVWKGDNKHKNNFFAYLDSDQNIVFVSVLLREKVKAFSKFVFNEKNAIGATVQMPVLCIYPSKDKFFIVAKSTVRNLNQLFVFDPNRFLDDSTTATITGQTINGLDRYNNTMVDVILSDTGENIGLFQVVGGSIDIRNTSYDGRPVEVGYGYFFDIETMPIEDVQNIGSSIGKLKNISELFVNPEEVANMTINGRLVVDKSNSTAQTEPFVNRTLVGWDRAKTINISQTKPLKLGIKNILAKVEVNE